jgi:hypothetical protein
MMQRYLVAAATGLVLVVSFSGCGGGGTAGSPTPQLVDYQQPALSSYAWPAALPDDEMQPWERLDQQGAVLPASAHGASGINAESELVPGVERYSEGSGATDNGEATSLASTTATVGYAIYRVPLGGSEPGAISVDANLTAGDGYYVGLGDYAVNAWSWGGPFSDNQVRRGISGTGDFTSELGNVFVCVLVAGGSAADVVAVAVNSRDPGDVTPPPAPEAPSVTAVSGGLLLEWLPVAAGDLAGYRIYSNSQWFLDAQGTGVRTAEGLEGTYGRNVRSAQRGGYVRQRVRAQRDRGGNTAERPGRGTNAGNFSSERDVERAGDADCQWGREL